LILQSMVSPKVDGMFRANMAQPPFCCPLVWSLVGLVECLQAPELILRINKISHRISDARHTAPLKRTTATAAMVHRPDQFFWDVRQQKTCRDMERRKAQLGYCVQKDH
jgi:hypothetical protein